MSLHLHWYDNFTGIVKKKLIVSVTVTKREEGWIKLNITDTATKWIKNSKHNNGLLVMVEDTDGHQLNAHALFESYNCSANASKKIENTFIFYRVLQSVKCNKSTCY